VTAEAALGLAANGVRTAGVGAPVFPDPAVRAAVVAARGEAFAVNYLDWCGWDAAQRRLIPRNGYAADRLRGEARAALAHVGVTVGDPVKVLPVLA
jgi:hypothetical protein